MIQVKIGDYLQYSTEKRDKRFAKQMNRLRVMWMPEEPRDKEIFKLKMINSHIYGPNGELIESEYILESIDPLSGMYTQVTRNIEDYINLGQNKTAIEVLYGEQLPKGQNNTY